MGEPLNIQRHINHLYSTIASSAVCGHFRKLSWAPKEGKYVVTLPRGRAFEQILAFAKDRAKTTDMFVLHFFCWTSKWERLCLGAVGKKQGKTR